MLRIFVVIFLIVAVAITLNYKSKSNVSPQLQEKKSNIEPISVLAKNLDTPWGIVFLPDKSILFTERPGQVKLLTVDDKIIQVSTLDKSKEIGEGGLLGITIHPNFNSNKFIYLYYTYLENTGATLNRVSRFKFENNKLLDEKIIVDSIPGASNHNGGRIKFGPDGYLYITTGDAQNPSQAQDTNTLSGKILRVTDEGKPAPGNPFNNLIFSYGHRNPQGLAWDANGRLWTTEHGRSGTLSGLDEVNLIESGKNYGWPVIQGDETKPGMVAPVINSGPNTTWAPAGAAFLGNSLFFGGLKGQTLYEYNIQTKELREHFRNQFGRIRDVVLAPDKMLYITTSNRDGRGSPTADDDRIIRINPSKL